ncbi:hypothetical protein [Pseudomonas sp. St29]|uniref:hypothetical protein n=1 Tax=Pseudomonas sp. St29 TaxID=1500687 RepID=UPI0005FC5E93|nr:hypothetical protein [Pseudomonas sp. St29]BAQ79814.1 putative uncharacterized protein [Pseudomonas sp. St29]
MTTISPSEFNKIPYLDTENVCGRIFTCLTFYDDGEWRLWVAAGEKLLEMNAWPCEAFYFSKEPAAPGDFFSHFLNFMVQRASFPQMIKPLNGLQDDFYNLSAIFGKLEIFRKMSLSTRDGLSRIIVTEVEYLFSVCRSIFDLLYEIHKKIWNNILINGEKNKKNLPTKLSKLMLNDTKPSNAKIMMEKYNLPLAWAQFYESHLEFFLSLRYYRDNIVHHGSQLSSIFIGDGELSVSQNSRPFNEINIWHDHEVKENNIVPLVPALAFIVHQTLAACENFTVMLESTIEFPPPLVPDMFLYVRGNHTELFFETILDITTRLRARQENLEGNPQI